MITLLPDPGTYGAAVIAGLSAAGGVHKRGAVLLRAAFDLVDDGTGIRTMQLVDDEGRFALVANDQEQGQESDFTVDKALADIVIAGFINGEHGGCVKVDGSIWRGRIASIPVASRNTDTGQHLFGWHGRLEAGRSITAKGDVVPKDTLPPNYSAIFNNVYRRSTGFSAPGLQSALPPAALVEVYQTPDDSSQAYSLRLPAASYSARLRMASHDCPDQPKRWAIAATFPLQADTLFLRPDAHQAEMVWRANWRWSDFEQSRLRAVQLLKEEN